MTILICQVNKVEAKKGGGGEYHAGKIMKYLGHEDFNNKYTYQVQFEDETKENVSCGFGFGWLPTLTKEDHIKVGSQLGQSRVLLVMSEYVSK